MPGQIRSAALLAAAMALASCNNPAEIVTPVEPYSTAASVVDSLLTAYNAMDLELYLACFHDDFQFHLLEEDWDDYDGDGIIDTYWGQYLEEEFHQAMFDIAKGVELTLSGTGESPWSGDTTGTSMALPRTFELNVYTDESHTMGYRASGSVVFICRQDPQDAWYIWQWTDGSDLKGLGSDGLPIPLEASSWGYIKSVFST